MVERGAIRNREAATQIRDFSSLRWGKITPTDIDGFVDFGDRLFVIVECKFAGNEVPRGQLLALSRLTDACHCPPRRICVAVIVEHDVKLGSDVDYAQTKVRTYRLNGEWRTPQTSGGLRLSEAIERIRAYAHNRIGLRLVQG